MKQTIVVQNVCSVSWSWWVFRGNKFEHCSESMEGVFGDENVSSKRPLTVCLRQLAQDIGWASLGDVGPTNQQWTAGKYRKGPARRISRDHCCPKAWWNQMFRLSVGKGVLDRLAQLPRLTTPWKAMIFFGTPNLCPPAPATERNIRTLTLKLSTMMWSSLLKGIHGSTRAKQGKSEQNEMKGPWRYNVMNFGSHLERCICQFSHPGSLFFNLCPE